MVGLYRLAGIRCVLYLPIVILVIKMAGSSNRAAEVNLQALAR